MLLYVPDSRRGVFQDSSGAVAAGVGDPIGLLLDRQYDAQADYITGAWAVSGATVSARGASITFNGTPSNNYADLSADLLSAKSYIVEYTVSALTAGDLCVILYANGYYAVSVTRSAVGTYREVLTLSTAGGAKTDTIRVASGSSTTSATVTGLSVKEVIGYRAIQVTAANKPTLVRVPRRTGPNLIVNGSFDTGTGWTLSAGSVVSAGTLAISGQFNFIEQRPPVRNGAWYELSYTVTASSGTYPIALSSTGFTVATQTIPYANGRNSVLVQCVNETLPFRLVAPNAGTSVTIDDIVFREVVEWSNAMDFNGVGNWMDVAFRDYFAPGAYTFVGAWYGAVTSASGTALVQSSSSATNPFVSPLFAASGNSHASLFERGDAGEIGLQGASYSVNSLVTTACVELLQVSAGSVGNFKGWRSGELTADVNYSRVTGTVTTNRITLGAAQRATVANFVKGTFVLMCWCPGQMSVADRKSIARFAAYLSGVPYV